MTKLTFAVFLSGAIAVAGAAFAQAPTAPLLQVAYSSGQPPSHHHKAGKHSAHMKGTRAQIDARERQITAQLNRQSAQKWYQNQ